jgi:hypothetical protein
VWCRDYWRATAERAVRAFASTLVSTWVVAGGVLDIRGVDWGSSLGVAGGAALISVLLSVVAGAGVGPAGSPSFVSDPAAAGKAPVEAVPQAPVRKVGGYTGSDQ